MGEIIRAQFFATTPFTTDDTGIGRTISPRSRYGIMKLMVLKIIVAISCFLLGVAAFINWYTYPFSIEVTGPSVVGSAAAPAYRQGISEAEHDLSRGMLKFKIYGMPEDWDGPDLYKARLWREYRIESDRVAGYFVTEELVERVRGYNDVSVAEIERRYGKGILDKVREQAVAEGKGQRAE